MQETTYRLVSANFGMILDVALDILSPNDRMIIFRLEKFSNVFGPRFKSVNSFLAEYTGQVLLDGSNGGRGKVVTKDSE
jgi:hypothetical protein